MNDVFLTQLNLGFRFISSENKIYCQNLKNVIIQKKSKFWLIRLVNGKISNNYFLCIADIISFYFKEKLQQKFKWTGVMNNKNAFMY